jgi:Sulfotransferase domain
MTAQMDRQLVSYPKSGRSWIRYVLHLLGLEQQVHFHHDGCEFNDPLRPPLALDFAARLQNHIDDTRTVYLRRDPRDVMVSLYFQIKGRMRDVFDFEGDVSAFIRDEYFGVANLCAFDRQWRELCDRGLALCVTYESCHENLVGEMRKILTWYDLDVGDRDLKVACQGATFQNMQAVELSGEFSQPWLRPRNGATKTRLGIIGGFAGSLSTADISFIEQMLASTGKTS